jgi:adenine-specific DNA methylase
MPETIDIHIKNIQVKLQLLLKKHAFLEKENNRLLKENEAYQLNEKNWVDKMHLLEQQVNILKASTGKFEGAEKKEFEKSINGYIKSIEKCIGMLNN